MLNSNLPDWPGASVVYSRVNAINAVLCQEAYLAAKPKRRTQRAWKYTVPEDVRASIDALDNGNEESLKAYVAQHLSLLFPHV